jgi:hypothetical protein
VRLVGLFYDPILHLGIGGLKRTIESNPSPHSLGSVGSWLLIQIYPFVRRGLLIDEKHHVFGVMLSTSLFIGLAGPKIQRLSQLLEISIGQLGH